MLGQFRWCVKVDKPDNAIKKGSAYKLNPSI